ncbi:MAG: beta-lactamase family protein [Steroidobacteraceae bacterium]|jgi:CubicO group peptidase (beta-lactamase class C family)|nr:beta-lactamase family protein [Steroidobacteraceae bacterium]
MNHSLPAAILALAAALAPSAALAAAAAGPSPAPPGRLAPLAAAPSAAALAALDARMRAIVDSGRRAGIVWAIARDGDAPRILAHGLRDKSAGRAMTQDSIFRIYSMTRAVSGVALLRLVEEGRIALDAPVERYVPQLANRQVLREVRDGRVVTSPATARMTVRQLLTYTSGLAYGAQYPAEAGVDHRAILALDQTIDQGMTKLASYPLRDDPGARWRYGYHSDVIGRLIEIGSGMRSDDYLQRTIFGPLGMVDTGFFVTPEKADRLVRAYDARGEDITARLPPSSDYLARKPFQSNGGGLVTTAADWIRFSRMLLNGGALDGTRILKSGTVAQMSRNQLTRAQGPLFWHDAAAAGEGGFSNRFAGYGWGFAIGVRLPGEAHVIPGTPGELTWGGLANTYFLVDRRHRLVALAFAQYLGADDDEADRVLRQALYGTVDGGGDR